MINIENYEQKYLKYKSKYLNKKKEISLYGGVIFELNEINVGTNIIRFYGGRDTSVDANANADAYVSASSIVELPVNRWDEGAGKIRDFVKKRDPASFNILEQEWINHKNRVEVGTARIINDKTGIPFLFSNRFYIIHAGSPTSYGYNLTDIKKYLLDAYKDIFKIIIKNDKIKHIVIMPLGIGSYGIDPKISAGALYIAIINYLKKIKNITITIPIYNQEPNSNDYTFGRKLHEWLTTYPSSDAPQISQEPSPPKQVILLHKYLRNLLSKQVVLRKKLHIHKQACLIILHINLVKIIIFHVLKEI